MMETLENILVLCLAFAFIAFLFPTLYKATTELDVTSGLQSFFNVIPLLFLVICILVPVYYYVRG